MTHDLKTLPKYFTAILIGIKTFEVRKNDRNFLVGDDLRLNEYFPDEKKYSGAVLTVEVTYIFKDFGLEPGYCVMAIKLK